MNNLFDILEICLQELENGADVESVLARYPEMAGELRPILKAAIMAKKMAAPVPSPEVIRRGRAKLLQHAAQLREQKAAPRRRMIPVFQRLAISFTLTAFFLASGTGLVGASSKALPGENLYPVKRSWEDVRLFFTFDPNQKELLASEFESERLDEVDELLAEGRDEPIQFAGLFMQVNGVTYVSGVTVLIPVGLQVPANGAAVVITGQTNAQGFVEITSIEILPDGAVVPVGRPIEVDNESNSNSGSGLEDGANSNSNSGSGSENGSGSGSANETQGNKVIATPELDPQSFEVKGTVATLTANTLMINGQIYYLEITKIEGVLKPGATVEIKGYYMADGRFIVTEIKVKDSISGGSNNGNTNSSSDSNDNGGSNSTSSSNSNEDSSGSGSGNGGGGGDG